MEADFKTNTLTLVAEYHAIVLLDQNLLSLDISVPSDFYGWVYIYEYLFCTSNHYRVLSYIVVN